jgi:hypothetical protein
MDDKIDHQTIHPLPQIKSVPGYRAKFVQKE